MNKSRDIRQSCYCYLLTPLNAHYRLDGSNLFFGGVWSSSFTLRRIIECRRVEYFPPFSKHGPVFLLHSLLFDVVQLRCHLSWTLGRCWAVFAKNRRINDTERERESKLSYTTGQLSCGFIGPDHRVNERGQKLRPSPVCRPGNDYIRPAPSHKEQSMENRIQTLAALFSLCCSTLKETPPDPDNSITYLKKKRPSLAGPAGHLERRLVLDLIKRNSRINKRLEHLSCIFWFCV